MDLVERARSGDADAFASLFQSHRGRVYAVCLRMTNNAAEAEDLTQDIFIQVFRKLDLFRGESALSTWLYRLAVNTVLMHFRKHRARQISFEHELSAPDGRPLRREFGKPDLRQRHSIDRIAILRALEALPEGYRRVFELHEIEGYEHWEIAELLCCSVGNSKSQLHKARLRMRKQLISTGARNSRVIAARRVAKPRAAQCVSTSLKPAGTRRGLRLHEIKERAWIAPREAPQNEPLLILQKSETAAEAAL